MEAVPVARPAGGGLCPDPFRHKILIDTIHDGNRIPAALLEVPQVAALRRNGTLFRHFVRERDWGANLVASHLAHTLGLQGYHRVTLARVVMDFNRFPGTSPADAALQDRLAISEPLGSCLDHQRKFQLLEEYYDPISTAYEAAVVGKLIKLGIHTYDVANPSQTQRPEVSLLTRSASYQQRSRMPYNLFSPLFPDELAESSAKRILRDRVALTVAKAGYAVTHNYPYCLPDGCVEIRLQPWLFFQHLRREFEQEFPERREDRSFQRVWQMLLNTNLRNSESEALAGYLHRFRKPPPDRLAEFVAARDAYLTIADYLKQRPDLVASYRRSRHRASALGIEIRKDLVWRFDGDRPVAPRERNARRIAELLARAVATFLEEDLVDAE